MKSSNRIRVAITILMIATLACNVSINAPAVEQPNLAFTAAAQTVAAVQASLVPLSSPTSAAPPPVVAPNTIAAPTLAPLPTSTFLPTATQQCDKAAFVTDVTYPDGTIIPPGQVFAKTWRLKNIGTCSWTPSYAVVFFSGESMSGPAVQALTGNVNPGDTVDITVNMKTPAANGGYTGYWKLRNASGVNFSQFYVQISVQGGGDTVVALNNIHGEGGQVRSNGTVLLPPNVGDLNDNHSAEAFFSFDISAIPSGATITKVVVNFSSFDMLANPWGVGDDGCVRGYAVDYGTLDSSDFVGGSPTGAVLRWCSAAELQAPTVDDDVANAMQIRVDDGDPRFQLRLQFRDPASDFDGVGDMLRFGIVTLTVTYQP